jgi:hypothetical protein
MSVTVMDLADVARELRLDDHLEDCGRAGPWQDCEWCRWALGVPEVELLLGARADVRALLAAAGEGAAPAGTVPWAVATGELLADLGAVDPAAVLVPSARRRVEVLRRIVVDEAEPLRRALAAVVGPDGPVERRCLATAGALAAAGLQLPGHRVPLDRLPAAARDRLAELSSSLSAQVQIAGLLPLVDARHWRGLPRLRTRPAWERLPRPGDASAQRARQLGGADVAPGSLEALVVEALIDRVTEALQELGPVLAGAAPPVRLVRRAGTGLLGERTRATTWRIARIDWHLTLVDSGLADCWDARIEDGMAVADVPWQVAVAIDVGERHGLVGATHADRSRPLGSDAP